MGELFYVIMEGNVVVKTPSMVTLEGEQATPQGLLIYILENFREIHWSDLKSGVSFVRSLILKELDYFRFKVSENGTFNV